MVLLAVCEPVESLLDPLAVDEESSRWPAGARTVGPDPPAGGAEVAVALVLAAADTVGSAVLVAEEAGAAGELTAGAVRGGTFVRRAR